MGSSEPGYSPVNESLLENWQEPNQAGSVLGGRYRQSPQEVLVQELGHERFQNLVTENQCELLQVDVDFLPTSCFRFLLAFGLAGWAGDVLESTLDLFVKGVGVQREEVAFDPPTQ